MPLLFSYGTLQDDAVQLRTFERLLTGEPDELRGQDPPRAFYLLQSGSTSEG